MSKKPFSLLLIMLIVAVFSIGAKSITLPDLLNPSAIFIDGDRCYVVEKLNVCIYSTNDFKLIAKFGKEGSGPQEFQVFPMGGFRSIDLHVMPEKLLINSVNKVSYFKKDGTYISELKPASHGWLFAPIGTGYIARRTLAEVNIRYQCYYLYDSDFKMIKEVYRERDFFQLNQKLDVVSRRPAIFYTHDNKLLIDDKGEGLVHVFDPTGKEIFTVRHDFPKVAFTKEHENKLVEFFLADPYIRPQYEASKNMVSFPSYFPYIWSHSAGDHQLYVLTYETQGDLNKIYIFDLNKQGAFIRSVFLPLVQMSAELPYPYVISGGKLYQLVESLDDEEWELRITDIK